MINPTWYTVTAFQSAAIAVVIAGILLLRRKAGSSHRSVAALLGATAIANLANAVGLLDGAHALFWREIGMAAELLQPAALLYVGLAFLGPAERNHDASPLWRARLVGIVGLAFAIGALTGQVFEWKVFEDGQAALALAVWGRAPYVFIVIGMTMGVAQLELVLRASREPVRHKLKFVVIGLGGLAGYQIYQASQMLLFQVWRADHVLVSGLVTTMALGLTGYGLARSRLRGLFVHAYISQRALVGSVTFIVIGLYLLAVGAVGEWLRRTDEPLGVGISVVVVFGALVALAIAAFSKTVRADVQRFLTRNFYRSKYDYRAMWLQVTELFQEAVNADAIFDRLLDLLIKTFPTTRISIWSFQDADRRFHQIRSMTGEDGSGPLELSHPLVVRLLDEDEPISFDETMRQRGDDSRSGEDRLSASEGSLCIPVRAQARLTAFIILGPQLRGEAYGTDECDLLHGISRHLGALLDSMYLAEERRASAELEALHRFSVFCLHDLKNLAARLSLVAQNAESHGKDPAFQESAMRTVKDTSEKMANLLSKLSLKSFKSMPEVISEPLDLPNLIHDVLGPIRGGDAVRFTVRSEAVPPVMAVREQIHQVFLNVVLNAKQAINGEGTVSITTVGRAGSVVVTIEDTGVGMSPSKLSGLFRPSQSNRPGGLGVGLYQCKQLVEAHHGTIQVRSTEGQGTAVEIELPIYRAPAKIY